MSIQTTNAYTIIQTLKDDIENKFSNGIRTEILVVKIGSWIWDLFNEKPAIAINPYSTELDQQLFNNRDIMRVNIDIDVFLNYNSDFERDWQDVFKFQTEMKTWLRSTENTYYESTEIKTGEHPIYIGSDGDPAVQGRLSFGIKYYETNS